MGKARLGIALLFVCEALISILQFVSSDEAVRQIVFRRVGDRAKAGLDRGRDRGAGARPVLPFSIASSATLTAVRGGEGLALVRVQG